MEGTQGTHPSLLRPIFYMGRTGSFRYLKIHLSHDMKLEKMWKYMEKWWTNDGHMMEKWWKHDMLSPSEIRVFSTMTAMLTMILAATRWVPVDGLWTSAQSLLRGIPRVGWLSCPFVSHLHIHNLQRMLERTPNKSAPQNEGFEYKTTTCIQDILTAVHQSWSFTSSAGS